jgi:hypothetical protein
LEEYGEHEDHIRILLERLREHQLYAKLRMCEFCIKEVPFLSHVVAPEGIVVWNFLGLASYYRRIILNFSKIAKIVTELLKKENKYV